MIGWACRQLAVWGGLALLLYAVVANRGAWLTPEAGRPAAAAAIAEPRDNSFNTLVYRADTRGHVVIEGVVNGAPVRFLVDTGATFVTLTLADAAAAGIGRSNLAFTMAMNTANGQTRAAPVRLRELRIGQLSVDDVQGIVQENLPFSLLGMSFLKRIDRWEMRDGALTLSW